MTEEEWLALSPEQQYEARKEQAAIDEARRLAAEEERARQEAAQLAAEQAKQAEIDRIIATNEAGSILDCVFEGGDARAHVANDWISLQPTAFQIVRLQTKEVPITMYSQRKGFTEEGTVTVMFDRSGRQLNICQSASGGNCARIALLGSTARSSFQRPLNVEGLFRGSYITCENAAGLGT